MKVINPTQDKIKVRYKGAWYEIEPQSELENVPKEAAEYWKTMIHNFISIQPDDSIVVEPKEEVKEEEEKEEVEEDVNLDSLTRSELDELAEEKEIDPAEFKNKADLVEALKVN